MEEPHIRSVHPEDIGAIAFLESRCFAEPWHPLVFEQFTEADGFLVAVQATGAEQTTTSPPDGRLDGYVVTTPSSHQTSIAHLRNLAVAPDRRRQGLGRRLLEVSLSPYRERGFDRVRLEVRSSNESAIGLYRSAGFDVIGRQPGYYENGEAAVIMTRSLDSTG